MGVGLRGRVLSKLPLHLVYLRGRTGGTSNRDKGKGAWGGSLSVGVTPARQCPPFLFVQLFQVPFPQPFPSLLASAELALFPSNRRSQEEARHSRPGSAEWDRSRCCCGRGRRRVSDRIQTQTRRVTVTSTRCFCATEPDVKGDGFYKTAVCKSAAICHAPTHAPKLHMNMDLESSTQGFFSTD